MTNDIGEPAPSTALTASAPAGASEGRGPTVRSSGMLMVAPMISAPGTLTLDDDMLAFERSPGLSGRLAPARGTRIAVDALSSVQLVQGELRALGGGVSLRLRGGAIGEIAAILRARGVPDAAPAGEAGAQPGPCFGVVRATHSSGPLQRHGHLAVGAGGLAFAPEGALDLATGAWPRCMDRGQVERIRQVRAEGRTLIIESDDEALEFINVDAAAVLPSLARLLHPSVGPLERQPWRCGALLVERTQLTPGQLRVVEDGVLVFADRAGQERSLGPLQAVFSHEAEGAHGGPVLDGGRAGWRARLCPHPDPIAALEEEVGRLPPLPPVESERARASNLARDVIAVRFRQGQGTTRTLRPAVVEAGDNTLDLLLRGGAFVESLPDLRLVLTLMGKRRLLRFGTRPWRIEPVDRDSLTPRQARVLGDVEELVRLRLPWPAQRELTEERNVRGRVRIHMDGARIRTEIGPMRANMRLEDLSGGGAGLSSRVPLVVDRRVDLFLGLPDIPDPLEAEVAWARRTEHGYVGGVRFQETQEAFQQLMTHYIYRMELLVARGERRPIEVLADQIERWKRRKD